MKKEYFSGLNYSLANEDTKIEYDLLQENADAIFSIAGSGARCLPLMAKNPKNLHIVDMSQAQLYLCELRFQAVKALTYEEWLFFIGYRGGLQDGDPQGDDRVKLFDKIELTDETRQYWAERKAGWSPRGFILLGHWESHFQKLAKVFKDYLKCDFSEIFKAQSVDEQINLYEKKWPHKRWKTFLRVLASEYVFNKYLYKGHFSGSSKDKTESRPPYQFVQEEFERIFKTQLVRKNYFMQILFLGEIRYDEGLPFEAHSKVFHKVKETKTKIHYNCGNLLDVLPKTAFNFVSLSDTISYLPVEKANSILQDLHKGTLSGSRIVIRSFMKAPSNILSTGWKHLSAEETKAQKNDGTSVYQFHIFEKL